MNEMIDAVFEFYRSLPPIVAAAITFVAGWLLAKLARFLVPKLLSVLRFDKVSEKMGIVAFLRKGNVHHSPSTLAGVLLYWLLLVIALSNTIATLDEGAAASIGTWVRSALPTLIVTFIGIVMGVVVVTFLSNFAVTIARNAAVRSDESIGKLIRSAGYIIVATMTLDRMGMGQTILSTLFVILFAAAALGAGLAFGLGCKDMARKAMEDFLRNLREKGRASRGTDLEG